MADAFSQIDPSVLAKLDDDDLSFLSQASGGAVGYDDDDDIIEKEPRFPKITVSIFSLLFIGILAFAIITMGYVSKYASIMDNDDMRKLANSSYGEKTGLSSLTSAVSIYNIRGVVYFAIVAVFLIVIGTTIGVWFYRHHQWEISLMEDDEDDNSEVEDDSDGYDNEYRKILTEAIGNKKE